MPEQSSLNPKIGLCEQCRHSSIVKSAKESVFYLCELAKTDDRFPKYPRLPVLSCTGFEQRAQTNRDNPAS